MPGTVKGGRAAAQTNKTRHGSDFYARIGKIGGHKGTTGGFAANRDLARIAGQKGGRISRRRKATTAAVTSIAATQAQADDTTASAVAA